MAHSADVQVRNQTTRRMRLHATVDGKVHRMQFGGKDDAGIVNAPQPAQTIAGNVWAALKKQKPVKALLEQRVLVAA